MKRWTGWLLLAMAASAQAHPLAPALLDIREADAATYGVVMRTSVVAARGVVLAPAWPHGCEATQAQTATAVDRDAVEQAWQLRCEGGLFGRTLQIDGLEQSGIDMIVRVESRDGAVSQTLVDGGLPQVVIAAPQARPRVFGRYLRLGFEHLLIGPDHLLLIAGLLLLVSSPRALFWTLSAFTLGHSVTLAAVTLGFVRVNPALMELAIAATLLILAVHAARPRETRRMHRPWAYALLFGLVHGLGFAGALSQIGVPQGDIALALLGFNLGIEVAQLAVVAALLTLRAAIGALARPGRAAALHAVMSSVPARGVWVYVIGSSAAYWCFQRAAATLA